MLSLCPKLVFIDSMKMKKPEDFSHITTEEATCSHSHLVKYGSLISGLKLQTMMLLEAVQEVMLEGTPAASNLEAWGH